MTTEPATGLLFTSMTCPNCPPAKDIFAQVKKERDDVELHHLPTHTPQGAQLAKQFGIMSVPTFVFYGPGHDKPMGLVGVQSKDILNKYIDIALGKRKLDPPKRTGLF